MKSRWFGFLALVGIGCLSVLSCGSDSSNSSNACNDVADALFDTCNQNDAADQQTIIQTFADFGITITTDDVESASRSSLSSECKQALEDEGTEVTDEEYQAGKAVLDEAVATGSCDVVASTIAEMFE